MLASKAQADIAPARRLKEILVVSTKPGAEVVNIIVHRVKDHKQTVAYVSQCTIQVTLARSGLVSHDLSFCDA